VVQMQNPSVCTFKRGCEKYVNLCSIASNSACRSFAATYLEYPTIPTNAVVSTQNEARSAFIAARKTLDAVDLLMVVRERRLTTKSSATAARKRGCARNGARRRRGMCGVSWREHMP